MPFRDQESFPTIKQLTQKLESSNLAPLWKDIFPITNNSCIKTNYFHLVYFQNTVNESEITGLRNKRTETLEKIWFIPSPFIAFLNICASVSALNPGYGLSVPSS